MERWIVARIIVALVLVGLGGAYIVDYILGEWHMERQAQEAAAAAKAEAEAKAAEKEAAAAALNAAVERWSKEAQERAAAEAAAKAEAEAAAEALRNYLRALVTISEPASPFDPACNEDDPLCAHWARFRLSHPFPYQTIAAETLSHGSVMVLLTEPAPTLTPDQLEQLVREAFGSDLKQMERLRWMIGIDGWVEDLAFVAAVDGIENNADVDAMLDNPTFRDRIALLHMALYGTAFGGGLEPISTDFPLNAETKAVPNFEIYHRELIAWLQDSETTWRPVADPDSGQVKDWTAITAGNATEALVSDDDSLVLLTFPATVLVSALEAPHTVDEMRTQFRIFAVASDAILGGAWSQNGQLALIGRARHSGFDVSPPLRFETFKLLTAAATNELAQSYERTNPLSGKLSDGQYMLRDWAPIFLSEPLIDTEFGALLNITDQILKSWSQAGNTEYLYFSYPQKPESFVLGQRPLSEVVHEQSGGDQVLFNWNTSGSASVLAGDDFSVLALTKTGALPVTYGSDIKEGEGIETGHLIKFENQAYDYFADLEDQNLQRVVQYTLIYQLFRAVASDPNMGDLQQALAPRDDRIVEVRAESHEVIVEHLTRVLEEIQSGDLKSRLANEFELEDLEASGLLDDIAAVDSFLSGKTAESRRKDARILADPREEGDAINREIDRLQLLIASQQSDYAKFNSMVEDYNRRVETAKANFEKWLKSRSGGSLGQYRPESGPAQPSPDLTVIQRLQEQQDQLAQILQRVPSQVSIDREQEALGKLREEIERREAELDRKYAPLADLGERQERYVNIQSLARSLRLILSSIVDLEPVRQEYIAANDAEPNGWIRTPSAVLSWDSGNLDAVVGGHNIDARALRFEASTEVSKLDVVETPSGRVVRFNPDLKDQVEANSGYLARAIEHNRNASVDELLSHLNRPVPERTRLVALGREAEVNPLPLSERITGQVGRLNGKRLTKTVQIEAELSDIARANDCCVFIARDSNSVTYTARRNASPPPSVVAKRFGDTVSLRQALDTHAQKGPPLGDKPLIFINHSPGHVKALMTGIGKREAPYRALARWLGGPRPASRDTVTLARATDLKGRDGVLELIEARKDTSRQSVLELLTGLVNRKTDPLSAQIQTLDGQQAQALLQGITWKKASNEQPSAVMVSFGRDTPQPTDVGVVASFQSHQIAAGQKQLRRVVDGVLEEIKGQRDAQALEILLTLKNDLEQLDGALFEKYWLIIRDQKERVHFSLLELTVTYG
jgi:hypothetical protein